MSSGITFAIRMDILMAWARQQGISVTYEAIGNAIGETPATLQKIHAGVYPNPDIRVIDSIGRFCGVGLDYWECQSEAECWDYLVHSKAPMAVHIEALSPEGLRSLAEMMRIVEDYCAQADRDNGKTAC